MHTRSNARLLVIFVTLLPLLPNSYLASTTLASQLPLCLNSACSYLEAYQTTANNTANPASKHPLAQYLTASNQPNLAELAARPTKEKYTSMVKETRNMAVLSLGIMGLLYVMPERVSKWDKSEMKFSTLGQKWLDNNKDGPVWDQDEWTINYIGHPYFGAAYYMVARNQGLSPWEAGGYSFLMSTFLWEMGIEALAEIPSKQDLIITPLIGSIIGETFFIWEQRILADNNQLWGSNWLGSTVLFLLNPAGSISASMNRVLDGKPETGYGWQGGWVIQLPVNSFSPGYGSLQEPGWLGWELKYGF